jgi:cell division protein YceG involved in septum cleavage
LSRGQRSQHNGERTAEDRERARQERAARRAQQAGAPAAPDPEPAEGPVEEPSPPSLADEGAAQELYAPGEAPQTHAGFGPPEELSHPHDFGHPDDFSHPEDPPQEAHGLAAPELPAASLPIAAEQPAAVHETADMPQPAPQPVEEAESGEHPQLPEDLAAPVAQPPAVARASTALRPPPPLPPELSGGRRSSASRRGGGSLWTRLGAVVALLAVIVAVVLLVRSLTHKSTSKTITQVTVVKVLIPEGETRLQIAEIARSKHLAGSYLGASKRSPLLDPTKFGAPRHTSSLEGFLFPATYDMTPGGPVNRLVEEQLIAFRERFGAHDIAQARALHVTPYQMLTVASMIEREAQIPSDRPKIAAVIYNRLREGMPLGIDATIYYAVELRKGVATYTHELTEADLHIDSPYNTRTHTGLPPTPISNPGEASIEAAAHPAHAAYLYYVAGADGCGEQVFSDTAAQFEANAASYEAAKRSNGGRPPVCKHK